MFSHLSHGEDVGNPLEIVPNIFGLPFHNPYQVGLGHSYILADVHMSVPFYDVFKEVTIGEYANSALDVQ